MSEHNALVALLKTCAKHRNLDQGISLHTQILLKGLLKKWIHLGNALISMYAKCGTLAKAQEVFDQLPVRNVVSWNALVSGYTQHGDGNKALNCFRRMQHESISPDSVTFLCILKACGAIGATEKGKEIHAEMIKEEFLENYVELGNALVDMYCKCGALTEAEEVFEQLPLQNVVTWTSLISGYAQHGFGEEALNCFKCMETFGLSADAVTFVCILKACGSTGAVDRGREIHSSIVREELLENNVLVGNALIDMYAKCGNLMKAQEVFDDLPVHDTVSWTVLIAGYAQHGHSEEALNQYDRMQQDGFSGNNAIFLSILKACGSIGAREKGEEIHVEINRRGLLEENSSVGTALVDMYAKCCELVKARDIFNNISFQDLIAWTTLIAGYIQHSGGVEAVDCYSRMQNEAICPDEVTFLYILKACSIIGALNKGKEIHAKLVMENLGKRADIGTVLIDMYAKCGLLTKAQEVFDQLSVHNVATWSVLIAGYGQRGEDDTVVDLFDKMIGEGIQPDIITFTAVLNSCSHSGLVDRGQMYFDRMSKAYGITPTLEHYTCMVDLFARTGHLDKTVAAIKEMPMNACVEAWSTLLSACRKWGNMDLGRVAFEHATVLDEKHVAAYVCMWNIYAVASIQENAEEELNGGHMEIRNVIQAEDKWPF